MGCSQIKGQVFVPEAFEIKVPPGILSSYFSDIEFWRAVYYDYDTADPMVSMEDVSLAKDCSRILVRHKNSSELWNWTWEKRAGGVYFSKMTMCGTVRRE